LRWRLEVRERRERSELWWWRWGSAYSKWRDKMWDSRLLIRDKLWVLWRKQLEMLWSLKICLWRSEDWLTWSKREELWCSIYQKIESFAV
jgi:hypothetical protein